MGTDEKFDMNSMLESWNKTLENSLVFSNADKKEIEDHLIDIYEDMIERGLEEREAFQIAVQRLGEPVDWEKEFENASQPLIVTRKTIILISGIVFFFFAFYLILFLAKLTALTGFNNDLQPNIVLRLNNIVLKFPLLLYIFFISSLLIKDQLLVRILEKIHLKPVHVISLVVLTLIFTVADQSMLPFLRNSIDDEKLANSFFSSYIYFNYYFPGIVISGYIILFFSYFRKTSLH
jgi:uncharacterized membrane-anchored protein